MGIEGSKEVLKIIFRSINHLSSIIDHHFQHFTPLNDQNQIVAALEYSVPSIPSLICENLGAPLFLGGYKVFGAEKYF